MRFAAAIVLGVLAGAGCERLLALDPVSVADAGRDATTPADVAPGDGSGSATCAAPFAYYQFEDPTALTDSSGNHYDGSVLVPGPTLTPGRQGHAYAFDGTDNVAELDAGVYQVTPLTVSIWFEPASGGIDSVQCFINQLVIDNSGNDADAWQLCLNYGTLQLYGSGALAGFSVGTPSLDTWHHAVLELDGSNALAWLDGSGGSAAFPVDYTNATKITLGADQDGTYDAHYAGAVDELEFFHCAVPADQLEGL